MSTLSATGAWLASSRSFERSLAELKQWRDATAEALAAFRRWAVVGRLLDEQSAARLAHLERRLTGERLTVAFVAEYSRGKSELINALFFAELRPSPAALGPRPHDALRDGDRLGSGAAAVDAAAAHRHARAAEGAARVHPGERGLDHRRDRSRPPRDDRVGVRGDLGVDRGGGGPRRRPRLPRRRRWPGADPALALRDC